MVTKVKVVNSLQQWNIRVEKAIICAMSDIYFWLAWQLPNMLDNLLCVPYQGHVPPRRLMRHYLKRCRILHTSIQFLHLHCASFTLIIISQSHLRSLHSKFAYNSFPLLYDVISVYLQSEVHISMSNCVSACICE